MKEGFDKEIDSLLRRKAGARAPSSVAAGHLDADELSAFAEGALPSAARVAAASHLADCVACRGVAVSLSRSSEALAEKRPALAESKSAAGASKRGWFASLFAPRVLKYVAPALALGLVAAVSFVALRTRREGDNTAQVAERNTARVAPAPQGQGEDATTAGTTANSNVGEGVVAPVAADEPARVEPGTTDTSSPVQGPREADAPDGSAGSTAAEAPPVTTAPPPPPAAAPPAETAAPAAPPKATQQETAETAKNEPKEKATRRAAPEDEVNYSDLAQQKRSAQQRGLEAQAPDGSRNRAGSNTSSNVANDSLGASAPRGGGERESAARRGRSMESGRDRSDDERRAEETRSVAGHRFRREGNAWVDVNYKPSMSSTGVRRGTETFRALVADFPELGRIASQLGGEVVVVIRGRAYRIR